MTDPLFGSGLRMDGQWKHHQLAASKVGLWEAVRSLPPLLRFALRLAWDADRRSFLLSTFAQLAQAAGGAAGVLAFNRVFAALLAPSSLEAKTQAALPALLVIGLVAFCGSITRAISTAAGSILASRVQRLTEERLLERVAGVELAILEDSQFRRSLDGAYLGVRATEQLVASLLSALTATTGAVTILGTIGVLHPLLIPLLMLGVAPQSWKAVTVARWEYASTIRSMDQVRQKNILIDLLTDDGAPAEEIRVHGLGDFLLQHYRRLAGTLELERSRLSRAQARVGVLADAGAGVGRVLAFAALLGLLLAGAIPLPAVATAVLAMTKVSSQLSLLLLQFNGLYKHGLLVGDYRACMTRAEHVAIPYGGRDAPRRPGSIRLSGVHFTYPGSDAAALEAVDLELRRGQVVALVGANGSGKSTLAKLIAGLHQPNRGLITWDGQAVADIDRRSLFSRVGWVAQDFQRWPFTARANTTMGRPDAADDNIRLEKAARFAGATAVVEGLPDGWGTLLAREFQGGTELSGGQWQRIALARAHFRNADILICDEPTAALDPITEVEAFDRLMALAGEGQTVLLITHRLGSIRHADRIYVLDHGRMIESGTYDELMALGGQFARMYLTQMDQYQPIDQSNLDLGIDVAPAGPVDRSPGR
ncbi:ABC transporter ATP-binding protein [Kribbella ginsengisoli]|uniref:ABC transporter ATP-binding protein n=1 Tax=Kribbella ginsengisoli TaxID=363865 RepID=A0ABP6Z7Y9_9ACTN